MDAGARRPSTGGVCDVSSTAPDVTGTNGPESRCTVRSLGLRGLNRVLNELRRVGAQGTCQPSHPLRGYEVRRYVLTDEPLGVNPENVCPRSRCGAARYLWAACNRLCNTFLLALP